MTNSADDDRDKAVEIAEFFPTREAAEEELKQRGRHVRLEQQPDGQWALKYFLPLEALGYD